MFRELMPQLAEQFHAVAPDLPGVLVSSDTPGGQKFHYTFDNIARVIDRSFGGEPEGTGALFSLPETTVWQYATRGPRYRPWFRQTDTPSTTSTWRHPERMKFSSISSETNKK